jgi:AcrR family transcriptional regulator
MRVSLRERKKAATRLAISDIATRLFCEHGYEQVTLAQVAEAADVSVKTIFNYFNSKEELYFDRAGQLLEALTTAIQQRPEGTTVLAAVRAMLADRFVPFAEGWAMLQTPAGYRRYREFAAVEQGAPALRARRLVIAEDWGERLAPVIAAELDLESSDVRVRGMAAMMLAIMGLRARAIADAVMAHTPADEVERRAREIVDDGFARLQLAYAELETGS